MELCPDLRRYVSTPGECATGGTSIRGGADGADSTPPPAGDEESASVPAWSAGRGSAMIPAEVGACRVPRRFDFAISGLLSGYEAPARRVGDEPHMARTYSTLET